MKKDIKWLRHKLETLRELDKDNWKRCEPNSDNQSHFYGSLAAIEKALDFIDELDDSEVLSQEWIDEHKVARINNLRKMTTSDVVPVDKLQGLLVPKQEITFDQVHDKLREESILSEKSFDYYWNCINDNVEIDEPGNLIVPKQGLPVIPKFVAGWIEDLKSKKINLLENIYDFTHEEDINNYIREQGNELMRAWLDGYTVEEEPLYQALIKGHEVADGYDIYWNCDKSDCGVFVSRLHPLNDNFITEMSKEEWNKLGINDSNADFVKVDE